MSALVLDTPRIESQGWLINQREDLAWFSGGSVLGLAVLALLVSLGWTPTPVVLVWSILLNAPHVVSTSTRALLDRAERQRIGRLWLFLIPLSIAGPVLNLGLGPWASYMLIVIWGHYHISKQHMGFVMLYRAKAKERSDLKLDKYFTLVSLMLPMLYYFSVLLVSSSRAVLGVFLITAFVLSALYVQHQIGREHNWPKLLLLLSCIPVTWFAFIYAASDVRSFNRLGVAVIVTNIPHSLQYLRLMWFHNHNRYAQHTGLLGFISSKWMWFFLAALILSIPGHILPHLGQWLGGLSLGFLLFHYTVDAKIWRVRGDKELASALRLN